MILTPIPVETGLVGSRNASLAFQTAHLRMKHPIVRRHRFPAMGFRTTRGITVASVPHR